MPDGVTTAIWQGRDAIKLGTVDEKMCLNPEAVKAAIDIGAVIEETACRKAKRGEDPVFCPFYQPATTRRKRRWPAKPTWCLRRTSSCSRRQRQSAKILAWSSSTKPSGRTEFPASREVAARDRQSGG